MVSDTRAAASAAPMPSSDRAAAHPTFTVREWLLVGLVIVVVLAVTALPYLYAQRLAGDDGHFMGVVVNMQDHFQYFSWMRESRTGVLVANQLTPETSAPLLFNLLWWVLGRIEVITGLDYVTLYQITRLAAGAFTMAMIYWFCGIVFENRLKRFTAFLVGVVGSGLGWLLVVEKYLRDLPQTNSPFALFTAEPNTFYTIMGFPHFTIATGLITLVFALVLLAQRSQNLRLAWAAAAVALLLSLQHAYDMFTIYGVIGLYGLFLWLRDRRFPLFMFKTGLIVALVSVWPALQAFLITNADDVWRGVLSQFDNAGAWTPAPWLLPILMGIGWLLALWSLDIRTPWRDRDDTHLFLLAWFGAHFVLIYLPLNFQIHLLSGWQVVIGVLATIGLYRRVLPWLGRRLQAVPPPRLALAASAALVLVVLPTNGYLLAQRFLDLNRARDLLNQPSADSADQVNDQLRADNLFFLLNSEMAALAYLETVVTSEDVVLSSLEIGQVVPALTGGRAFLAHWAQTLNFLEKRDQVAAFYSDGMSDAERLELLTRFGVDYVFHSPEERKLGDYDPGSAPFLREVFRDGSTAVYQVISETASR